MYILYSQYSYTVYYKKDLDDQTIFWNLIRNIKSIKMVPLGVCRNVNLNDINTK